MKTIKALEDMKRQAISYLGDKGIDPLEMAGKFDDAIANEKTMLLRALDDLSPVAQESTFRGVPLQLMRPHQLHNVIGYLAGPGRGDRHSSFTEIKE